MKFYYAPKTIALASHIVLEEAGARYDLHKVDFAQSEQRSADFLRINPKGRVPALETEHGILTETPAILAYLAQSCARAQLGPIDDFFAFAKLQEFNAYLASTVHVAHAHRVRGNRWADDEAAVEALKAKVAENMTECFSLIEEQYFVGPWVLGEHYSVCDAYLFTIGLWLEGDGVDIKDFPRLAEHSAQVRKRPATERVLPLYHLQ